MYGNLPLLAGLSVAGCHWDMFQVLVFYIICIGSFNHTPELAGLRYPPQTNPISPFVQRITRQEDADFEGIY
jgi:hypothetical protein